MLDAVAVVLLVAAGEGASPTVAAMAGAARDTLGAAVEVRESSGVPTDGEALGVQRARNAAAVVEVVWDEPAHKAVRLRVHLARSGRWLERSLAFLPSDPAAERGRTLGFAVALVIPEGADTAPEAPAAATEAPPAAPVTGGDPAPSPEPARPAVPAPVPPPSPSPPVVAPPAAEPARPPPAPVAPITVSLEEPAPRGSPGEGRGPRFGIDLAFGGSAGIGGSAGGVGAVAGFQWSPVPPLAVRVGAAEQTGTVDRAEASLFVLSASAGLAVTPIAVRADRPVGFTVRADYVLMRQSLSHFGDGPAPETRVRWLSGFDVFLEGNVRLTSQIGLLAGLGLEDLLAPTYIDVKNAQAATIPPVRVMVEAGFRLRF